MTNSFAQDCPDQGLRQQWCHEQYICKVSVSSFIPPGYQVLDNLLWFFKKNKQTKRSTRGSHICVPTMTLRSWIWHWEIKLLKCKTAAEWMYNYQDTFQNHCQTGSKLFCYCVARQGWKLPFIHCRFRRYSHTTQKMMSRPKSQSKEPWIPETEKLLLLKSPQPGRDFFKH